MDDVLAQALAAGDGLVASALCSHSVLTRGYASGRLAHVLPGVHRDVGRPVDTGLLARALALHDPRAVVRGAAAAALTWWPELPVPIVDASRPVGAPRVAGYRWTRGVVPEALVAHRHGLRVAAPAMSVLDLIPELGGDVIDEALRRRATTVPALDEALRRTPGRPGNGIRRTLLADSRDAPWSAAERAFHRLLRGLRLPWPFRANHRIATGPGNVYVDAALPQLRLGFEVDGYAHHRDAESFEEDRLRLAELWLVHWRVFPLAAVTVLRQPERTEVLVRRLVFRRAAELGLLPTRRRAVGE